MRESDAETKLVTGELPLTSPELVGIFEAIGDLEFHHAAWIFLTKA